jgi:acyl carrier protein
MDSDEVTSSHLPSPVSELGEAGAVSRAEIDAVFPAVADLIADALAREPEEVKLESRLMADLGAESIDFLDVVFRLEQTFNVRIERGRILEEARGGMTDDEFHQDGVITPAGLAKLRQVLDEVPADAIVEGMRVDHIPMLFTVETICKVVARAKRAA